MTIRFINSWNGYYEGQIVTNPNGGNSEAQLIALGYAVADLDGPDNSGPLARYQTDPLTGGVTGLVGPDGGVIAIDEALGTAYEPTIASARQMRVTVDAGGDVDHAEVLITFNAADVAIASERLVNADTRADVIKTALTGAAATGAQYRFKFANGLTSVYVGLRGAGPYTQAAGATVTALQAVLATWLANLNLVYCTVVLTTPYVAGGANKRYRDLIVTGYTGV